jgi:hypothetical protein
MKGAIVLFVLLMVLGCDVLLSVRDAFEETQVPASEPARPPEVVVAPPETGRRIVAPLAILVLDVSSSMTGNDRERQQAAAARLFLDAYRVLVAEALGKGGGRARVGVVVFSSAAQVVKWPDGASEDDGRFLVVPPDEAALRRLVDERLVPFLGVAGQGEDPRRGYGTAYGCAAAAVDDLVGRAQARGPVDAPCVAFMTDGADFTFYGSTPTLPPEQRERWFERYAEHVRSATAPEDLASVDAALEQLRAACSESPPARIAPPQTPWNRISEILDPDKLSDAARSRLSDWRRMPIQDEIDARHREGLAQVIRSIRSRRYPTGGPTEAWLTVVLDPMQQVPLERTPLPNARSCRSADGMHALFVEAIAKWLAIDGRKVTGRTIEVPPDTRAFAVVLRGRDAGAVTLRPPGGPPVATIRTAGAEGGAVYDALVASPAPGTWTIESPQAFDDATVWMRRRFEWALARPAEYSALNAQATAELGVVDTEGAVWVDPGRLGGGTLPGSVEGALEPAGGGARALRFVLREDPDPAKRRYVADLPPASELPQGRHALWAPVPSAPPGGPPQRVQTTLDVIPAMDVRLEDGHGGVLRGVEFPRVSRGLGGGAGGDR